MKTFIKEATEKSLEKAKEIIANEYRNAVINIDNANRAIGKAIAAGSCTVSLNSFGGGIPYYSALQYIRSCQENRKALAELYEQCFDEPIQACLDRLYPPKDPDVKSD